MANVEFTKEEGEEEIVDISPDNIELTPSEIKLVNVLYNKILVNPDIRGGNLVTDIDGNTTNITINAAGIATNVSDIAGNTTQIGINSSGISANVSDIGGNTTQIGINASGISTNVTDIGGNTTNITQNATDITTNATSITTNEGNITTNITNITTNAGGISSNVTSISNNAGDISTNTTNISQTSDNIQLKVSMNAATLASVTVGNINGGTVRIAGKNIILNGDVQVDGDFSVSGDIVSGGTITGSTIQSATSGNNRLQIIGAGYTSFITWWDSGNNLESWLVDDFAGSLLIHAPTLVQIDAAFDVQGNISTTGTVDGVDIAGFATNYNALVDNYASHVGDNSAHHSSTSNALAITPSSVNAGSGTIGTTGWIKGGKLYGDTGSASFKVADMNVSGKIAMAVNVDMNNNNINEINTLTFNVNTGNPATAGQIQYYDSGGTQQFRGNVGGWTGSFDMTAT